MGTLYVVATPIGNLEDITLRALRLLGEVDEVLAEDTRRARILLDRYDISARPRSLHAHNEAARIEAVLGALEGGRSVALISDAGTPLLSDPGERLVVRAVEAGHEVVPIPGASALLPALVASGLPTACFTFHGFLPRKAGERASLLASLSGRPETQVFFESPRRLVRTLKELCEAFGDREACVGRELTKLHEEFVRASLSELAARFSEEVRGEITLVVAGTSEEPVDPESLRSTLRAGLAEGRSAKDLAAELHRETGVARRTLYQMALEEKD